MLLVAHRAVHEWAGAVGVRWVLELSLMGLGVVLTLLFLHLAMARTLGADHGAVALVGWGGHRSQSQLWLQQHRRHKQLREEDQHTFYDRVKGLITPHRECTR